MKKEYCKPETFVRIYTSDVLLESTFDTDPFVSDEEQW